MKYNARIEYSAHRHTSFKLWLAGETVSALSQARGDTEKLKTAVFVFLHRAYEAGLDADEIADLLGVDNPNIMSSARLSPAEETALMQLYEQLDVIIGTVYE